MSYIEALYTVRGILAITLTNFHRRIAEDSTKIWSEAASESHNAAKATFQSHNESASGVKNPINSHSNTNRSADTAMTKKWSAFYNSHA